MKRFIVTMAVILGLCSACIVGAAAKDKNDDTKVGDTGFTAYSGSQSWPTDTNTQINKEYSIPIYLSLPDKSYKVLGRITDKRDEGLDVVGIHFVAEDYVKIDTLAAGVFLAQAAPAGGAPNGAMGGGLVQMLMLGCIFVAMYFFMIAPQRKKQKEHDRLVAGLKSGDDIVTTGGIFGTITNVKEDRFVIKVSDNTKIEVGKGFISTVLSREGAADK